ncbi:MAG: hypothetical protein KGJ84_02870 [Elusimicrobia bacterium]|nr:hypothetical protein [Elusimicrobiota bacterium]
MKALALVLSLSVAASAAPAVDLSTSSEAPGETIIVRAPRQKMSPEEIKALKVAQVSGGAAAGVGAGLMGYVLVLDLAGPFGWAASLIFLGGMTVYLSHRRLRGHEDFLPNSSGAPAISTAPVSAP